MTLSRRNTYVAMFLALVCASIMGYVAAQYCGYGVPELPGPRSIVGDIIEQPGGFSVALHNGATWHVDAADPPDNAVNMALLYPGKSVTLVRNETGTIWPASSRPCVRIVPLAEENPVPLAVDHYRELVRAGFTNADLAYSYKLPSGVIDSTPDTRRPVLDNAMYARLSICATSSNNP